MIDGTYFPNKVCLVAYRDFNIKTTLLYRLTDNEWECEIREDLENILSLGVEVESVTCDGGANLIKSVKKTSKEIIIQFTCSERAKRGLQSILRVMQANICVI